MSITRGLEPRSTRPPSVVFADDGAPAADAAWSWIAGHDWQGWRLEIVTVHETLPPGDAPIRAARHVERVAPAEMRFVSCDHVDPRGDPRVVLLGYHGASLVVVGSHHRGHLAGLWAGSTTEWLIVGTPFPLLVARHGHRTRSVAICVDGSIHAHRAMEAYLSLPWSAQVTAHVLTVDDGTVDVEQALARATAAFAGRPVPPVTRLVGAAKRVIPDYVRDNQVDLVVLGTRGLTGLKRMAVGSTVSALLKDDAANLLIAHVVDDGTEGA
ncbi:universal stress protein [Kineosporia sp. A_224]|uniref:universal stress protein n=1 Tax=Kineosporia sp. A_224 TaxID=1962180 RepID=UPI000B4B18EF|nr:universal stress protein [Kineosporia sp. A_224]